MILLEDIKSICEDDLLVLTDADSLRENSDGITCKVSEIQKFSFSDDDDDDSGYYLLDLDAQSEEPQRLFLGIECHGEEISLYVFFLAEEFEPSFIPNLLEEGWGFLFQDEENDYRFRGNFDHIKVIDESKELFRAKEIFSSYGDVTVGENEGSFYELKEWVVDSKEIDNPDFLAIRIQRQDEVEIPDSGIVYFFQGLEIGLNDLELYI